MSVGCARKWRRRLGATIDAPVKNFAGETTLAEFIELAAACRVYLTNDSGPMHIASALGVPTVAVFGATNDVTTGPTGVLARVVRAAGGVQPLLEARVPHRPSLHDSRRGRPSGGSRAGTAEIVRWRESIVDSRTKIVPADEAHASPRRVRPLWPALRSAACLRTRNSFGS